MKKQKKNYAIIILLVILLALAVGYATFTASLTIDGTVNGTGTWDIHFKSATLKESDGTTAASTRGSATVSTTTTDDDTITATVNLSYPGDAVMLEVVVENEGSIPAKLTSFSVTGLSSDPDVEVTYAGPSTNETLAANGGTCTAQFVAKWKSTSTATEVSAKTFTVSYSYTQNTTEVNITPAHSDV